MHSWITWYRWQEEGTLWSDVKQVGTAKWYIKSTVIQGRSDGRRFYAPRDPVPKLYLLSIKISFLFISFDSDFILSSVNIKKRRGRGRERERERERAESFNFQTSNIMTNNRWKIKRVNLDLTPWLYKAPTQFFYMTRKKQEIKVINISTTNYLKKEMDTRFLSEKSYAKKIPPDLTPVQKNQVLWITKVTRCTHYHF